MISPFHLAVAPRIQERLSGRFDLQRDQACGGDRRLPLFIGPVKAAETRMCCVDLLVVSDGTVRAIVEIEESGFLPTKICGKFFQAMIATHFIHDSVSKNPIAYAKRVLFVEVLDGSKWSRSHTRKPDQVRMIEKRIKETRQDCRSSMEYMLFLMSGAGDSHGLDAVVDEMIKALRDDPPTDARA